MSFLYRFVWLSDVHIGSDPPYTYDKGEPEDTIAYINSLDPLPLFLIDTGDCAHRGSKEQEIEYSRIMNNLSMPWYVVPGNRDMVEGDYDNFNKNVQAENYFVFDGPAGKIRYIGIETYTENGKEVSSTMLDWLTEQSKDIKRKTAILFGHCPLRVGFVDVIPDEAGGQEVKNLLTKYNYVAYLSGHSHDHNKSIVQNGITYVDGTALIEATRDQINLDGGLTVCDVYSDKIELDYRRGRSPWDSFNESTTPSYSKIIIPLEVDMSKWNKKREHALEKAVGGLFFKVIWNDELPEWVLIGKDREFKNSFRVPANEWDNIVDIVQEIQIEISD